jgi:hypothetical protein
MVMTKFKEEDVACWADGSLGHEHVRERLASIIEDNIPEDSDFSAPLFTRDELIESLRSEMPDDAWDEFEAIDMLNQPEITEEGLVWWIEGGDLLLVKDE